jgi:hypothetical protein
MFNYYVCLELNESAILIRYYYFFVDINLKIITLSIEYIKK